MCNLTANKSLTGGLSLRRNVAGLHSLGSKPVNHFTKECHYSKSNETLGNQNQVVTGKDLK